MKVLNVITSLRTGGAEKLVVELTAALRERGHIADVALFDGSDATFKRELDQTGCKTYIFSHGGSVYSPRRIFQLAKVMKDYDIVHTHNTSPQFFAAIASLFSSTPKLVTTEHNTTNRRRDKRYFLPIDRWMYNRYKKIICISDKAYTNLMNYLKKTKAGVVTIKNGVNLTTFTQASPIAEFKREGTFAIVMVAAFRPQKDQGTLIKAIQFLPKEYELYLVGQGETRPSLEELSKQLEVDQRVHFLGLRRDIPNILKSADVIVMSSHYEGLSLSSIEGMCVGKPFVASDVDGLKEVVQGAGILVAHKEEQALAQSIKKLCTDVEYAKMVAERCFSRAQEYDFSKMAESYNELYMNI
ncbi:MAG: glycosyltransferase [Bacteroidales bacterium]|nr:glycosyltransferase [Bacteroidales bacterium]